MEVVKTSYFLSDLLDNFIGVWNLEKGRLERKLEGHGRNIHGLKVNGDGNLLISVGKD